MTHRPDPMSPPSSRPPLNQRAWESSVHDYDSSACRPSLAGPDRRPASPSTARRHHRDALVQHVALLDGRRPEPISP
jgi:hypothetical protein